MPLPQGALLGRYQVLGLIGSGGMGEVYRARDTHLQRDVALKVLAHGISADAAADARFDREARSIASLSHPNICAVHDAGVDDGRRFLIMELLEGETLQEKLQRGPLDFADVVLYALAISEALQTAHSRDLIHRDLKPGNIFLTKGGQLKILDFGLAKAMGSAGETTQAGDDLITARGSTVGTAAYMSPEQIRGEPLDARSDLFSFGLVLYESATGVRAFSANTPAAAAARILTEGPPPPSHVRVDTPAELERIILKALEKERDLRYQTAADMRADLKRLQRQTFTQPSPSSFITPPPGSAPADTGRTNAAGSHPASVQNIAWRRRLVLALGVGVLLLSAVVALAVILRRDEVPTAPSYLQVQPLTLEGQTRLGTISPDGRFLVYQHYGDQSVRARQISSNTEIPLVPPGRFARISSLTITPDGNSVDVVAVSGSAQVPDVWRVPLLGGPLRQLLSRVVSAIGWSPDGSTMAFVSYPEREDGMTLVLADANGSQQRELVTRGLPFMFYGDLTARVGYPQSRPSFSPDGTRIALTGYSTQTFGEMSELLIFDARTGTAEPSRQLRGVWKELSWLHGDQFLLVGNGTEDAAPKLWLSDLEGTYLTPVTQEHGFFENLSVTADRKTAVAKRFTRLSGIWVSTGSGADARIVVPPTAAGAALPTIDARGGITFTAFRPDGFSAIYHLAPGTSTPVQVVDRTAHPFGGRFHDVSSDGRTIVFSQVEPPGGLFKVQTDGSAPVRLVDADTRQPLLTRDAATVLFLARTKSGVFSVPAAGGGVRQLLADVVPTAPGAGRRGLLSVSPDGTRLLVATQKRGTVLLCDLPQCSNKRELSLPSADWAPSGQGVAYVEGDTRLMEQPLSGGPPRVIARMDGSDPIINFRWSPDGLRLATSRGRYPNDLVIIRGLPEP